MYLFILWKKIIQAFWPTQQQKWPPFARLHLTLADRIMRCPLLAIGWYFDCSDNCRASDERFPPPNPRTVHCPGYDKISLENGWGVT